uniref:WWE domain-containing protein n=1 Tax=Macrostomum lignano TaxID=282301 RepID=A0A1I8FJ79_9PLAT
FHVSPAAPLPSLTSLPPRRVPPPTPLRPSSTATTVSSAQPLFSFGGMSFAAASQQVSKPTASAGAGAAAPSSSASPSSNFSFGSSATAGWVPDSFDNQVWLLVFGSTPTSADKVEQACCQIKDSACREGFKGQKNSAAAKDSKGQRLGRREGLKGQRLCRREGLKGQRLCPPRRIQNKDKDSNDLVLVGFEPSVTDDQIRRARRLKLRIIFMPTRIAPAMTDTRATAEAYSGTRRSSRSPSNNNSNNSRNRLSLLNNRKLKSGEETTRTALFCQRAKLYRWTDGQWKARSWRSDESSCNKRDGAGSRLVMRTQSEPDEHPTVLMM